MSDVTIYTKPFCPYCSRALGLLAKKGVDFQEIDDAYMNADKKREMVKKANGGSTFPQIFIGERHIGGCDELMALEDRGELDRMLAA